MWDFLFYSALRAVFSPAKLREDEVWNPAGGGGIRLFSPVAERLTLRPTGFQPLCLLSQNLRESVTEGMVTRNSASQPQGVT